MSKDDYPLCPYCSNPSCDSWACRKPKEYSEPPTQADDQTQKTLSALLDQIESRANAATPGPWLYDGQSYAIGNMQMMLRADGVGVSQPDAAFIAAARSDVPALVKALRRAMWTIENPPPGNPELDCYWQEVDKTKSEIAKLLREPADSKNDL